MSAAGDPRVYFAAERTLLAWLRTGIAVVGLGFVVARFGLFLRMLRDPGTPQNSTAISTFLGTMLVLIGAGAMLVAAVQHYRFSRRLAPADLPQPYLTMLPPLFALLIGAIALLLAAHLSGQI